MVNRKQIAFDLDTKSLKAYYPTKNYENAYKDIQRFMTQNGFEWQQGSVYNSRVSVNISSTYLILEEMVIKYPWLHKCMRDCTVTNIGREFHPSHLFQKDVVIPTREELEQQEKLSLESNTGISVKL